MLRACGVTRRCLWPRGAETSCTFGVAGKQPVGLRPKETTMWSRAVGCLMTLTLSLLAAPLIAEAQQPKHVHRIGVLSGLGTTPERGPYVEAFLEGMRALGYVEGQNLVLEYRAAAGHYERFPDLAAELVRLKVDVLMMGSTPAALAAKRATTTIPIVMVAMGDPVGRGRVRRPARWQHHRIVRHAARSRRETAGVPQGSAPHRLPRGRPLESRQSSRRPHGAGGGRGGPGVGRPAPPPGGARSRRV